ncbi:hypothetical protein PHOSAC3_120044 [Mesotoga infera]|nr:hypothetical protein PHOSAC3_120044 [Mesotoga infera]
MLDRKLEIADILRPLSIYLSEPIMIRLNFLVDVEALEPDEVSRNFLKGVALIKKEKEALLQWLALHS